MRERVGLAGDLFSIAQGVGLLLGALAVLVGWAQELQWPVTLALAMAAFGLGLIVTGVIMSRSRRRDVRSLEQRMVLAGRALRGERSSNESDPHAQRLEGSLDRQLDALRRFRQGYEEVREADSQPRWSPYDFLRDQHREAVRLLNLPWKTTEGSIADLSTSLGRLSGVTEATLRSHGLDREADDIEPLGPPRHLPSGGYDQSSLLSHQLSVLRELTERIAALRDRQPRAAQ